jgi:heterotetrameric sarcosine oxidase gamma subunit
VTDALAISEPYPTSLVRVEAFELNDAFAHAFKSVVGASPAAAGRAEAGKDGPALWAEPKVVLVSGDADALEAGLGAHAAVSDVSGAWRRIDLAGPIWREVLMVGGVFDAESASFGPGALAATMLHHAPVMIHARSENEASVYVAPSFAQGLRRAFLKASVRRG